MNISGINRFVYYKFLNKRILLLGEIHENLGCKSSVHNVISIKNYLYSLIPNIPKDTCLDLFLEGSYKEILRKDNVSNLFLIRTDFEKKKFYKFRLHHTDPRYMMIHFYLGDISSKKIVFSYAKDVYEIISLLDNQYIKEKFTASVSESDLTNAIDYLLHINTEENRECFLKIFRTYAEIERFYDLSAILSWEKEYFKIINKEMSKLDTSMITKETLISNLSSTYKYIKDTSVDNRYEELMLLVLTVPMDVYTLTRMFIKFEEKPNSICALPTVDNVIVYSGAQHSIIYEHFLKITFEEPKIKSVSESENDLCVSIPKFDFWKF